MALFRFGVATEANTYEEHDNEDQIWIKNEQGKLILMGGENHESTEE